jgi:hypothetical protein
MNSELSDYEIMQLICIITLIRKMIFEDSADAFYRHTDSIAAIIPADFVDRKSLFRQVGHSPRNGRQRGKTRLF